MGNHYHLLPEAERLHMGCASNISQFVSEVECAENGILYKFKKTLK